MDGAGRAVVMVEEERGPSNRDKERDGWMDGWMDQMGLWERKKSVATTLGGEFNVSKVLRRVSLPRTCMFWRSEASRAANTGRTALARAELQRMAAQASTYCGIEPHPHH